MRIGIDLRPLQNETKFRGIGIYLYELLRAMAEIKNKHTFVFFVERAEEVPEVVKLFKQREVVQLRPNRLSHIRFVRAFVSKNRTIKASRHNVDVVLVADGELGVPTGAPSVLVFHDIIPLLFKDDSIIDQSKGLRRLKRQLASRLYGKKYKEFLNQYVRAHHIIAISKNSLSDLHKYLPNTKSVPATVIYHGGDQTIKGQEARPSSVPNDTQFLLYVGGIDIRKNVIGLIKDFIKVKQKHPELKLVMVGKEFGLTDQLRDLGWQKALKGYEEDVITTGFVNTEELEWLYSNAVAFVFPSRYEGFGLPILEAMNKGCPVIAYRNSAIPEVAGKAAVLIKDGESMTTAMCKILEDTTLRKKLVKDGITQARKFTWSKTAKQTLVLLESVANEKR